MIRAVLFDLDGVLTNTSEYHFLAWKKLSRELGIPFSRKFGDRLRGVSRRESLTIMLQGREVTEKEAQEYMERKNAYYKEFVKTMSKKNILPGVLPLLRLLRKQKKKIALASVSKNTHDVLARLEISSLFDGIADGHSVDRHKPEPDIFLYAASLVGCKPEECVVVEDAASGVEAAHRAGMKCIGVGKAATGADRTIKSVGYISPASWSSLFSSL